MMWADLLEQNVCDKSDQAANLHVNFGNRWDISGICITNKLA